MTTMMTAITKLAGWRKGHRLGAVGGAVALSAAVFAIPASTATAAEGTSVHTAAVTGGGYLALGDSVAFGYRPPEVTTPAQYLNPANFTSYADDLAAEYGLALANASCPGETTGSFINSSAQSNGCENSVGAPGGYRVGYPLHVAYPGSQLAYAVSYLQSHPDTRLVTMTIGANDAFVCQETTADHCTSPAELTALFTSIETNLTYIYSALRNQGGYQGPIVALDYYALDYSSPSAVAGGQALDSAINSPTRAAGGLIADGLGAFSHATAPFAGSSCAAGLLVALPAGGCNIHPSAQGHRVLAGAFTAALATAGDHIGTPGYVMATGSGTELPFGGAVAAGSLSGTPLNAPVVGIAQTPTGKGTWMVGRDGAVFASGDATFAGSAAPFHATAPFVGMAPTPGGAGYWLVGNDGGVFSFGDAGFFGSEGGAKLNAPIVAMASTFDGNGYWLVASDGGVFAFGDAAFFGSEGGARLNRPIVGVAATPDGEGYWLVASDGGVFAFGDAGFFGSLGASPLNAPVVGMAAVPDGGGYWLVAADGGIFTYGDAAFAGSAGGTPLPSKVVGVAVPS